MRPGDDKNNQERLLSGVVNVVNDVNNVNETNEIRSRERGLNFYQNTSPDRTNSRQVSDLNAPMSDTMDNRSGNQNQNSIIDDGDPDTNSRNNINSNLSNTNSRNNSNFSNQDSPNNSGISVQNSGNNSPPSDTISNNNSASDKNSKQKSTSNQNSGNNNPPPSDTNTNSAGSESDGVAYAENLKEKANDLIASIIKNLQYLVKNDIIDSVKALNQITNRFPPSENTFEYLPLHEEPSKLSTRPFKPYYAQVKNKS